MSAIAVLGSPSSHGGTITSASTTTFAEGRRVARVGDGHQCPIHGPSGMATGSPTITVDGKAVCGVGSVAGCGARISAGVDSVQVDT